MDLQVWAPLSGVNQSILDKVRLAYVFGRCGNEALIVTEDDEVWVCALIGSSCFSSKIRGQQNVTLGHAYRIEELSKQGVEGLCFGFNKKNLGAKMNYDPSTFMLLKTSSGNVIQVGQPIGGLVSFGDDFMFRFSEIWDQPKISEVACGSQHCLALSTTGEVFSWGCNEWGQVGNGDSTTSYIEVAYHIEDELRSKRVVRISCGFHFSVAVLDNGLVYTWGKKIGENNTGIYSPELVPLTGVVIKEIVCGFTHVLALTNTWELYVWGLNNRGQLGLGDDDLRLVPVKNETIEKVVDIAATYLSSISAVKTADSEVFMWGDCSGSIVKNPVKTPYKSLMDVFAYYCSARVTYKPIVARHCQAQSGSITDAIKKAFEDEETSDLIIKAQDREIFVHRTILRLRSDYFRSFLKDQWTKGDQKIVEIKRDYNVIHPYLRYLYTGEFEADLELAFELMVLADEYQDMPFKELCETKIQCGIEIDNVGILYPLALKINATRVQESCLAFASSCLSDVVATPAFSTWDRDVLMEFIQQCRKKKMFIS